MSLRRSSLLCFVALLGQTACGHEIVLGDSEAPLPVAGSAGNSGGSAPTAGNANGTSGNAANTTGGSVMPDDAIAPPGELVWSTDFEVGDFSDWDQGGAFYGGEYEWGDVDGYVDLGVGRDGSNGVVADLNTAARSEPSAGVRMYRRIEPASAYYSAWFKLEEAHTVADWWSIFLFHARDDSLSLDNDVSLWDVRLVDTAAGDLALQFFDHDVMLGTLAGRRGLVVPGEWFELTAYLDYRPPNETRVVIFLDGALLFDMKALHTAVQANVFWSIGNGAARLDPADSTLYLDDAAIRSSAP